jgi:alpha-glucuronidase
LGFDRTRSGSGAVTRYAPEVARTFGDVDKVPEKYLLWFHHVPWDRRMASGRTLWDELVVHYSRGVDGVAALQRQWAALAPYLDPERHAEVTAFLAIQAREARWWRDACIAYFQTFAQRPLPAGFDPPEHPLDYYEGLRFPFAPGR